MSLMTPIAQSQGSNTKAIDYYLIKTGNGRINIMLFCRFQVNQEVEQM